MPEKSRSTHVRLRGTRRSMGRCPCCGQRLLMRHGVALSPMLADLLDMVERAGRAGILPAVLIGVFYPGKPTRAARRCIYTNVHHLNSRLAETDFEVRAAPHEPYRLQRRPA